MLDKIQLGIENMGFFKKIFFNTKSGDTKNELFFFMMDEEYHHVECERIDRHNRRNILFVSSSEIAEQKGFKPCWSCLPQEKPPRIVVVKKIFELRDKIELHFEKTGSVSLSQEELDFFSVVVLNMEVNHGGFFHFLFYAHDDVIENICDALIRIGADRIADIVKQVFMIFKGEIFQKNIDSRQELLDPDNDELTEMLFEADNDFDKCEDNFDRLLYDFYNANQNKFIH